ncbi:hypothetical protein [Catenuloplanes atrovinosus]|uniref:Uncharacterized protein n=1 Tax=Catenuloplanes atrovinosus TaxID=137266 RepID=A0AAE3YUB0_9ACTN|nr:hypothetical protein [Catenuloplanes atrovinosus]MDR7280039.1 hypothetical protein [Catenuloplanes atrovinosus]
MSSSDASLTEAQWDLLADYLGGVLDGDPRHDEVTALIASDSEWRDAHAALADATGAVHDDLRTLAEAPVGPMPDDVAARLDAALRGEALAPVIPLRRRRFPRWALPATIAAGVLAFAAVGITGLLNGLEVNNEITSSAGSGADAPEAAAAPLPSHQVVVSGRDYTSASARSLAELVEERGVAAAEGLSSPLAESGGKPPAPMRDDAGGAIPPVLARLTDPEALNHCLGAIAIEHGVASLTARLIDYASFEGSPGLLVLFTDSVGQDMVWVAGPQCGADGMLADTRYSAPVG